MPAAHPSPSPSIAGPPRPSPCLASSTPPGGRASPRPPPPATRPAVCPARPPTVASARPPDLSRQSRPHRGRGSPRRPAAPRSSPPFGLDLGMSRPARPLIWLSVAALSGLAGTSAWAAEQSGKPSELVFFLALAVVILVGRLLGELLQRIGQPAVMGQLLGGLLLGPSVFGALAPEWQEGVVAASPGQKAMLHAVSQLRLLLLLLPPGMETDLALVRRVGRAAASVSVAGIVLPFACGFALGQYLPENMLPH